MEIKLTGICKSFGDSVALNNVDLIINPGELVALLGPSGSGKTTLLRIIAGLETPDSGILKANNSNIDQLMKQRKIGFVFQHYALFQHMTVFDNVAFALKILPKSIRPTELEIKEKVVSLLSLVHLGNLFNRYPAELSGGQRQRVALARSLSVEPELLLLDEPFGALDSKVRKDLRRWMRNLHNKINLTSLFVTHDQDEAMEMADKVIIMNRGRIEQIGTPEEVYTNPHNAFIYDFLGNYNAFSAIRDNNGAIEIVDSEANNKKTLSSSAIINKINPIKTFNLIKLFIDKFKQNNEIISKQPLVNKTVNANKVAQEMQIFARPHDMEIFKESVDGYIKAKVIYINTIGPTIKLELQRNNEQIIQVETTKEYFHNLDIKLNDYLYTKPKEYKIFE